MSGVQVKTNPQPNEEPSRGRSTIEFPYLDQDDAVAVVEAVHQVGGTSCSWEQLAAQMKQSATGGGFRMRVMTARFFGLLTYDRGSVELSELGIRILDPKHVKAARAESFLHVPLYKAVYEKLKGAMLPPPAAIDRLIESLGVAPKQKEKARQVFMRSAKSGGFLEIDSDRLTFPPIKTPPFDSTAGKPPAADLGNGNGGTPPPPNIPAAILGLLSGLPAAGTPMDAKKKEALVSAFAATIGYIYPD